MKIIWIDYVIFAWLGLFLIETVIELVHGKYNQWVLPIYLVVWCGLMLIKTYIKKK